MILKMINEAGLSKQDRKKFIPFVNQRNHMGEIIKNKPRDKQYFKSIQVFQNLKKTTKQYFFDKKYQKMKQKLSRCKLSLEPKQHNYDQQIKECFKTLQKSSLMKCKTLDQTSFYDSNTFFVDLNERLNQNISTLKQQIERNKHSRIEKKPRPEISKFRTFHNNNNKNENTNLKESALAISRNTQQTKQNKASNEKDLRKKAMTSPSQQKKFILKKMIGSVNRQIFKDISSQSQKMVDFTNCGMKYKKLVQQQKKDPWKKWYVDSKIQIFPGESVKLKKLQKSIYD